MPIRSCQTATSATVMRCPSMRGSAPQCRACSRYARGQRATCRASQPCCPGFQSVPYIHLTGEQTAGLSTGIPLGVTRADYRPDSYYRWAVSSRNSPSAAGGTLPFVVRMSRVSHICLFSCGSDLLVWCSTENRLLVFARCSRWDTYLQAEPATYAINMRANCRHINGNPLAVPSEAASTWGIVPAFKRSSERSGHPFPGGSLPFPRRIENAA